MLLLPVLSPPSIWNLPPPSPHMLGPLVSLLPPTLVVSLLLPTPLASHLIMLPPSLLYHMCLLKCNKPIQGLQVQLVPKPSIGTIQAHHLGERQSGQRATRMCSLLHQVCQYSCLFAELTNYCYSVDPTWPPSPKPAFLSIIKSNTSVSELLTLLSLSPPPPTRTRQWSPPLLKPHVPHASSPLLRSSGTYCSTWVGWLQPRHLALWWRSFCFRYSVRALGLWQYGWYVVMRAWEISQAYEVFRGGSAGSVQ